MIHRRFSLILPISKDNAVSLTVDHANIPTIFSSNYFRGISKSFGLSDVNECAEVSNRIAKDVHNR